MKKSTPRRQFSFWMRLILPLALVVPTLSIMTACGGGGSSSASSSTTPAAEPSVTFSSTSLTFSSQQVGSSSSSQSVTLTNSGNATLMISGVSTTGTDASDFAQTNTCGSSVNAGANCTIAVTFKPTASGSRTASVSVADNATGSPQTVSLSGTGSGTAGSGGVSTQFFGMTVAFNTQFPYANLWPTVTVGTMAKVPATQWAGIERTQGQYDWTNLDNAIQMAQSNGVNSIIYTIFGVPTFYSSNPSACSRNGCPGPPTDLQAFSNFINALVTRYKGKITYYELWNEGNSPDSWSGTTAQLVTLSQTASQAIKQIDPNAKVLAPSPNIGSSFASFVEGFLSQGGASSVDGVAWHAYRCQNGLPSGATCLQGTSCDDNALDCAGAPLETQIQQIQMSMQNAGTGNMPIYDTEGGWGQNQYLPELDDQEAYVSRWYIIQASEGVVTACWFGWGGDPTDLTAWGSCHVGPSQESQTQETPAARWCSHCGGHGSCRGARARCRPA